jgi:hypothetical protein
MINSFLTKKKSYIKSSLCKFIYEVAMYNTRCGNSNANQITTSTRTSKAHRISKNHVHLTKSTHCAFNYMLLGLVLDRIEIRNNHPELMKTSRALI